MHKNNILRPINFESLDFVSAIYEQYMHAGVHRQISTAYIRVILFLKLPCLET